MDKAKSKGISFSKDYKKEYEYVMGIKGASRYICELIRKDLEGQKNKTIANDSHKC